MLMAIAVLRTIFLVFIIGFTVRAMPWFTSMPRTLDEQYSRCASQFDVTIRAVWLAIGWIALETLVGWWLARRRPRPAAGAAPATPPAR